MNNNLKSEYATFLAETIGVLLKRMSISGEISVEWNDRNLRIIPAAVPKKQSPELEDFVDRIIFTIKLSGMMITKYCIKEKEIVRGKSLSSQFNILSTFYPIFNAWIHRGWIKTNKK